MDTNQFEYIYSYCSKDLKETTSKGEKWERKRESKYSKEEELFITLFWLRHYPTNNLLEFIFNLDQANLMRIISKNIDILYQVLQGKFIEWPNDNEFDLLMEKYQSFTYGPFRDHICLIDGTEIRIRRSKDSEMEKRTFSMKKRQHSLNFLLITLVNGRIIYSSRGYDILQNQVLLQMELSILKFS